MPGGATIEMIARGPVATHTLVVIADLAVTSGSLPAGLAGVPYEAQVEAAGGAPPYRWVATGLPPGLSIDQASGRIFGTPITAECVRWPCPQPSGSYTATFAVTDSDGIRASVPIAIALAGSTTTATAAPTVTKLGESHRVWREGGALARISKKKRGRGNGKKPPVGTTFSFTLNAKAAVTFKFTERLAGREVGRRCAAKTRRNRKRKSCKRTVPAGALSFSGHAGMNKLVFMGRISRTDKLQPGRYTLIVTATNPDGQRSAPVSLSFTIVR
jgi:hypothetical protein